MCNLRNFSCFLVTVHFSGVTISSPSSGSKINSSFRKSLASFTGCAVGSFFLFGGLNADAVNLPLLRSGIKEISQRNFIKQSSGWELARQKRTAAVKLMEEKGILQIKTDDAGNQFLNLPWFPDKRIPYKSLSFAQRLTNEVFAGALGELAKDCLLHPVDTLKTRRQAQKNATSSDVTVSSQSGVVGSAFSTVKGNAYTSAFHRPHLLIPNNLLELYSGFPVVLMSSIPQGGAFFLCKKGIGELINKYYVDAPLFVTASLPIGFGAMTYWLFRTPAEIIKTKVQTKISPNIFEAYKEARNSSTSLIGSFYRYYHVMLWLDIPFQIMNFVLYGALNDFLLGHGFSASVWTRLLCGTTCGMISSAFTCPIDTCKTRMISRDRAATAAANVHPTPNTQTVIDIPSGIESSSLSTMNEGMVVDEFGGVVTGLTAAASGPSSIVPNRYDLSDGKAGFGTALLENPVVSSLSQEEESLGRGALVPDPNKLPHPVSSTIPNPNPNPNPNPTNSVLRELINIATLEGPLTLFSGIKQRLIYTGLANGIRLTVYGTARMDLIMRSLESN